MWAGRGRGWLGGFGWGSLVSQCPIYPSSEEKDDLTEGSQPQLIGNLTPTEPTEQLGKRWTQRRQCRRERRRRRLRLLPLFFATILTIGLATLARR